MPLRMLKAKAPFRSRYTKAARPWWRSSCGQEHTGGRELLALLMAALGVRKASEPVAKNCDARAARAPQGRRALGEKLAEFPKSKPLLELWCCRHGRIKPILVVLFECHNQDPIGSEMIVCSCPGG